MNKFYIIGNIVKDCELNETPSGIAVCRFSVAVKRDYSTDGEQKTDFFNCTAWRGLAETISKYCHKGDKVAVNGSVQLRQYEDNKGNKHNTVDVVVSDIEFLTSKKKEDEYLQQRSKPTLKACDDDSDIPF